jgi:hypothetical protein
MILKAALIFKCSKTRVRGKVLLIELLLTDSITISIKFKILS